MSASIVMVVRDEPLDRVERALDAVRAQDDIGGLVVVIAAPEPEHEALRALRAGDAVEDVRLVANPSGARSAGLNRAVASAPHDVVVRVDARARIPRGYVAACVRRLAGDPAVGVVGGVQCPGVDGADPGTAAIARALRNPWLLGNAPYRRPEASGPVDTVYLGAFRRAELLALGGYDEGLHANEDFELALRYRDTGRTVWLEAGQLVDYEPRGTLDSLARQYCAFGAAKVRFWRRTGRGPNRRQQVALVGGAIVATAAVVTARRPARVLGLALAAGAAVAAIDHVSDPGERDPSVRARSCAASAVIVASWCWGVLTGLVREARATR